MLNVKCFFFFLMVAVFSGCSKPLVQVYQTASEGLIDNGNVYTFENDTLKINYTLWSEKGVLAFSLYNKLNKPIYIDWKKSSFIKNSEKLNFWEDAEKEKSLRLSKGSFYRGTIPELNYLGLGFTETVKVKPERITFIPPSSKALNYHFQLVNDRISIDPSTFSKDKKKITDKVSSSYSYKIYSKNNTPLIFRNFITISTTEDFKNEFYVDNEFYVKKLYLMTENNFVVQTNEYDKGAGWKAVIPFKNGLSFYVK